MYIFLFHPFAECVRQHLLNWRSTEQLHRPEQEIYFFFFSPLLILTGLDPQQK